MEVRRSRAFERHADRTRGGVRGLGEAAFRTEQRDATCDFYEAVIGLPVADRDDTFALVEVGEGYGGHTDVLAVFDRTATHEWVTWRSLSPRPRRHPVELVCYDPEV